MSGVNHRALALGVVGAVALFAGLFALVDVHRVIETLSRARTSFIGLAFLLGILWLIAWSMTLRTVLGTLEVDLSPWTSFLVYAAAVFANNVTPFGQAGGEPVTALLISDVSDTRYETGLVGIGSVDVLNVVSSLALVFLGIGVYASSFTLGTEVSTAVGSVITLALVIVVTFTLVWRNREWLVERMAGSIASFLEHLSVGPVGEVSLTETDIADRMRRFFGNVEVVATDRPRLAASLAFSTAGWMLQAGALMASFAALGYQLSPFVALFVIPLGNLAGAAPLPGGLGGIEAAFVALLVPTTVGVGAAVVTAAVLLFRLVIYWMPVVIGGTAATGFSVHVLG